MSDVLFQPLKVGRYDIAHRIVYAPLTRCRAIDNIPHPNAATYYKQRATEGGLMISEATVVCPQGIGYPAVPGIFKQEQVDAWRPIVDAVHSEGAIFFMQIWNTGAISHQGFQPSGQLPVSASSVRPEGELFVPGEGMQRIPTPRALDIAEIPEYVEHYRIGARNAIEAGFDGVEVHAANGYLIDQFLKSSNNTRTDEYGGPIENRARFALEVVRAVSEEVGSDRVGVRLSPFAGAFGVKDDHPYALITYLLEELNSLDLAYVHFVEPRNDKHINEGSPNAIFDLEHQLNNLDVFRRAYKGTFLAAGGYKKDAAVRALSSNHADAIVFGRWFLANPDFVHRLKHDAPLNPYERSSFYTQDPVEGFLDYPTIEEARQIGMELVPCN